jgi:acyl-CoA synthetase (AMP-forming)/AMP-acid ligase II
VALSKEHFSPNCVFITGLSSSEAGKVRIFYIDKNTEIDTSTVPVGFPVDDKEVRLVDDDGNDVGFDQIGEIEVRSPYLRLGYWRKPELTR